MTKTEIFNGILAIIGLVANVMGIISFVGIADTSFLEYSYSILNLITFYSMFVITWLIIRKKYEGYINGKTKHRTEYSIIKTTILVGLIFLPIHIYIDDFFVILYFVFYSLFTSFIIKYMMPIIFQDMKQFLTREGEYLSNIDFTYKRRSYENTVYKVEKEMPIYIVHSFLNNDILGELFSGYVFGDIDNKIHIPKEHFFKYFEPIVEDN